MDLFLKLSVAGWEMIRPWKDGVAGKKVIQGV